MAMLSALVALSLAGTLPRLAYVKGVNAREMLVSKRHGTWEEVTDPASATLVWLRNHRSKRYSFTHDPMRQIYNKLPTSSPLTDKANLFINCHRYEESSNQTATSCMPYTFPLTSALEVDNFLASPIIRKGVWIIKQTRESMGVGITIHSSEESAWWDSPSMLLLRRKVKLGTKYVAQRYLQNPLLLEGRKCEVRLYWAVISLRPLIAVVYNVGQVRVNSEKYTNNDFSNPLKHLTNIFQQKNHPEYSRLSKEGALKWSLDKFRNYTTNTLGHSEARVNATIHSMKRCLLRAANATAQATLGDDAYAGRGRFELFGADFLLDDTLKVYLTEVQQGPGLSINDPVKAKVLRPVLQRLADLALEVQEKTIGNQPLDNLNLTGSGYEYLVNEAMSPPLYLH